MADENDVAKIEKVLQAMSIAPERIAIVVAALQGESESAGPAMDDEALLTPRQLCERLGVSGTTLWRLKGLPFLRVGSRKRFILREICEFLAKRQAAGKVGAA